MRLGEANTPEGMRLYAIGDVHGRDDLLAEAHDKIAEDLVARPAADHRIIHCGDYVDRGPDSAAVVARLVALTRADARILCLRGNHEDIMLSFLADPAGFGPTWLYNGGGETLLSYGVPLAGPSPSARDFLELGDHFAALLPPDHRDFIEGLGLSVAFGGFFFCHAGIRPGVPLPLQSPDDLVWIREEFLLDGRDFGAVVIHGHTPAPEPEVRLNRINIDTGAVFTGRLTCLALEGTEHRFL
jgi:serine/threonine protein phosphatase 1